MSSHLPQPRCPFCHLDVNLGEPQVGCGMCRAWHHRACWTEARWRCAACRTPAPRVSGAKRRLGGSRLRKVLLGGLILGVLCAGILVGGVACTLRDELYNVDPGFP